ncbi:hypothetical protein [Streptomyces sp. NPDC060022]|uniref:hypothetical protein n=1 Tax=Streptomyces sp. NPDC060022 TaxID=3347039 RepID=UPI0036CC30BE
MGHPDRPARAVIAHRRSDAIDLHLVGVDWLTIARKLAADPTANSAGGACGSYGARLIKMIHEAREAYLERLGPRLVAVRGREAAATCRVG